MQRRNFILGLGTVATLSGAASVTGANLADSATADSDFRVIIDDNELAIAEADGADTEADPINFTELDTDDDLPQAYVEGEISGEEETLEVELATENGESNDFNPLLTLDGTDLSEDVEVDAEISAYGDDEGDTDDDVDSATIDDIYTFDVGGQDILEAGSITLTAGTEEDIDVNIDTTTAEDEIADASDAGSPFESDENDIDLVNEITFNTSEV